MDPVPPNQPRLSAAGYHVIERLRRGPESVAYLATREADRREVALTVFHAESYPIEAEAARLRRLPEHPHLVQVLGSGRTEDGRPFLVLPYHPHRSYEELLARDEPVSVDEAVRVGIVAADALEAVHGAGLVHGDVTPGNLLRGLDGPLLTGFGLAEPPEEVAGTVALDQLTPPHAAPEVLQRRPVGPWSDVYGLASTLWTLLAGYPPFGSPDGRAPDPFEYREHALNLPVPPVPRGDVPWWLQAGLRKAMAKSPGDRHASAAAFAAALRDQVDPPELAQAGRSEPVPSPPVPSPPAPEPPMPQPEPAPPAAPDIEVPSAGTARSGDAVVETSAVHGAPVPHPGPAALPVPMPEPEAEAEPEPEPEPPPAAAVEEPAATEPPAEPAPIPAPPVRRRARSWVDVRPEGEITGGRRLPVVPAPGRSDRAGPPPGGPVSPDEEPPPRRPLRLVMVGAIAFTVMLGAVLVAAVANNLTLEPNSRTAPPAGVTSAPSPVGLGAPTDLELADERVAVTLSWQDPTGGEVSFTILGGPVDSEQTMLAWVGPGETTVRINALNPRADYCFQVVTGASSEELSASERVCTTRSG